MFAGKQHSYSAVTRRNVTLSFRKNKYGAAACFRVENKKTVLFKIALMMLTSTPHNPCASLILRGIIESNLIPILFELDNGY